MAARRTTTLQSAVQLPAPRGRSGRSRPRQPQVARAESWRPCRTYAAKTEAPHFLCLDLIAGKKRHLACRQLLPCWKESEAIYNLIPLTWTSAMKAAVQVPGHSESNRSCFPPVFPALCAKSREASNVAPPPPAGCGQLNEQLEDQGAEAFPHLVKTASETDRPRDLIIPFQNIVSFWHRLKVAISISPRIQAGLRHQPNASNIRCRGTVSPTCEHAYHRAQWKLVLLPIFPKTFIKNLCLTPGP